MVAHLTNYNTLQTVAQLMNSIFRKFKLVKLLPIKVSALPDQTFTGKVAGIANEGTSTNGVSTFDVNVSIDNPQNLKVGMSTETEYFDCK